MTVHSLRNINWHELMIQSSTARANKTSTRGEASSNTPWPQSDTVGMTL